MSYRMFVVKVLLSALALVLFSGGAMAQFGNSPSGSFYRPEPRPDFSNTIDEHELSEVGWTQNLNQPVPLDLKFRDETGKEVTLKQYYKGKPVVIEMVFFYCPMLCIEVLRGTFQGLDETSFKAGRDYEMLVVSINPKEGPELAAENKNNYIKEFKMEDQAKGIHFLTGEEPAIKKLASSIGFGYVYDEKTEQFGHPAGLVMTTPEGQIARYMSGVIFEPRDLRLGFLDAGEGKIGTPLDLIVLKCYRYDGQTGRYTFGIMNALRIVGAAFVILTGLGMLLLVRRDIKRPRPEGDDME